MIITLIRHTSVDVPPGVCYGQTDVPLKDTFVQEAAVTKKGPASKLRQKTECTCLRKAHSENAVVSPADAPHKKIENPPAFKAGGLALRGGGNSSGVSDDSQRRFCMRQQKPGETGVFRGALLGRCVDFTCPGRSRRWRRAFCSSACPAVPAVPAGRAD